MRVWVYKTMAVSQCHFWMVSFWRPLFPLFPLFWVNQKGVFCIFLKMGNFSALLIKTFPIWFIEWVSMDIVDWHQFFEIQENKIFFNFNSGQFWSKNNSVLTVNKSEFWWMFWACHRQDRVVWSFFLSILNKNCKCFILVFAQFQLLIDVIQIRNRTKKQKI